MFFISPAYADTAAQAAGAPGIVATMLPLMLVFLVFYFLVIRPQNKRIVEHRKSVDALKKGDEVVTGGGIIGKIQKLDSDTEMTVRIADGLDVRVLRHSIMSVRGQK